MHERGIELALEPEEEPTTDSDVFYNEDMRTNRDVSTACLAVLQQRKDGPLRVCDALAASGVRGLRYLQEVDGIQEMLLNDIKPEAVENIRENIARNDLPDEPITVSRKDANLLLTENFHALDYVDIDPFGSPVPYLDSAARSLSHEAAIGVTATDLGPLYGSYPEVCRRRYGSTPIKASFGHEVGLRILIKEVFRAFARYDYAFTPLLAWHEQHYSRVVGTVEESKKQCNRMLDDIGMLSFCRECRWRGYTAREECPNCGGDVEQAGELWTGPLADTGFAGDVREWLASAGYGEPEALIETVGGEAGITVPFYDTHELASSLGVQAPRKEEIVAAIREKGYRVANTHFSAQGIRTDAPLAVIQGVLHEAGNL